MRARSVKLPFRAQNAQIDTLFPIQEPSRLFKSRPTSRVVGFTETRRSLSPFPSQLLHPRILLSLRRNQFGISVNRPLSPRNTASRDSPLNRDPITLPMLAARHEFLHGSKDTAFSLFLHSPIARHASSPSRKEGGGGGQDSRLAYV